MKRGRILALLCAGLLVGCSLPGVVNRLTPADGYRLRANVEYGALPRQRMDLYIPVEKPRDAVVLFVHGGAWEEGDKADFQFVGQAFAELGFVTAIPNYRLYPHVAFPAFVEDVALAMAALDDQVAAASCPDGRRVILAGHSAGAHTAALLATDPGFLQRAGAEVELAALIALAGPYDLPLDDPRVKDVFRGVEGNEANPVALANAAAPPALLIHGLGDKTVLPLHSERFAAALGDAGVAVDLKLYPGEGHLELVGGLAKPLRLLNPVFGDIRTFVDSNAIAARCP